MLTWLLLCILVPQQSDYAPVATVTEIMEIFVIPSSNELFNVFEPPEGEEAWKALETNAIILAESGNLLMLPERAEGRDGWIQASQGLAEVGQRALETVRARNGDQETWFELSDQILETCSSCHEQYWLAN